MRLVSDLLHRQTTCEETSLSKEVMARMWARFHNHILPAVTGPMQLGLGFPLPQGPIDEVTMNLYDNAMLFGHRNVFGHHRVQVPQIPEAELADLQELFGVGAVPAAGLDTMNIVSQNADALTWEEIGSDDDGFNSEQHDSEGTGTKGAASWEALETDSEIDGSEDVIGTEVFPPKAELVDLQGLFGVDAVPTAGLDTMGIVSLNADALTLEEIGSDGDGFNSEGTDTEGAASWEALETDSEVDGCEDVIGTEVGKDSYYLGATGTFGLETELVLDEGSEDVIGTEVGKDSYYLGVTDTVGLDSEDDAEDITDETSEYDMDDLIVSLQDLNPFSVLADLEKESARYEDVDGTTDVARNQADVSVKCADMTTNFVQ